MIFINLINQWHLNETRGKLKEKTNERNVWRVEIVDEFEEIILNEIYFVNLQEKEDMEILKKRKKKPKQQKYRIEIPTRNQENKVSAVFAPSVYRQTASTSNFSIEAPSFGPSRPILAIVEPKT